MLLIHILFFTISFFFSYLMWYRLIAYNPYGSELVIGKKGAGKTTYQAYLSKKYVEAGWNVFCTTKIPGTYYIDYHDIGKVLIPEDTVLLIDEAGLIWNSRDWKNLGKHVIAYLKYCRHYRVKIILFTQSDKDIDCTFMRVADTIKMMKNIMSVIGTVRTLKYKQVLIPASEMAEARITDDIVKVPIIFGGLKFFWMPKYWQYFDSYSKPLELVEKNFDYIEFEPHQKAFMTKEDIKLKKKHEKSIKKMNRKLKKNLKGWNEGKLLKVSPKFHTPSPPEE